MAALKLSSPWALYYRQVAAMFAKDPAIRIEYDEEALELNLYVEGSLKADALTKILPAEKTFGSVTLKINVIPANCDTDDPSTLFDRAFDGNPAVVYIAKVDTPMGDGTCFVVFENEVVQYFNDNIFDINGVKSTLYEDIAGEIFSEQPNTFYCTDVKDMNLQKPLGEWP